MKIRLTMQGSRLSEAILLGTGWRALRRRILTPNISVTSLDIRGFHKKSPAAQELLETVGKSFLGGYAYAAEARAAVDAEQGLKTIPTQFRGFAYEGAAMGFAIRDGLPLGGRSHVADFLAGRASAHVYMVYIGIGWAMARLPRMRWPRAETLDPLLRWFVLDGYGFHQAYFQTAKYVDGQYQRDRFPWPGDATGGYANRAIDQGIGRAMWFVGGTDAERVATMIDRFPAQRRADLYSGAGLAATYAGGADEAELLAFQHRAGAHSGLVAQACAFAAEARVRAGLVVPHTHVATQVFCGTTPERAAQLTQDVRPDAAELAAEGEIPAYEAWRRRIANEFVPSGGIKP
jgi:enediyne biosynthesis protein E3